MLNVLQDIRGVLQAMPALVQEAQAARAAITELIDLLPVEVISLVIPDFNPPDVAMIVSPPPPAPTVQPVTPQPAQPQPEVLDGPTRSGGSYAYIPLDLGGQFPPRTTPQPPKIHRPPPPPRDLAQDEQAVLICLADAPRPFDVICQQTKIPAGPLSATLLTLELTRRITRMAGDLYAKGENT